MTRLHFSGRVLFRLAMLTAILLLALACGSSPDGGLAIGGDGGAPTTNTGGGDAGPSGSTSSTSSSAGGSEPSGPSGSTGTGTPPQGLNEVGSLVVLGDSIGDGGGEGPYYYDVLIDALSAHYASEVAYRNHAESGSKTSALLGQVQSLPPELPGPVAVVITSGGNDMKDQLLPILAGLDEPARVQMGDNVQAALEALLVPDRFGGGVAVHVFFATIYDASDGVGDYQSGGCVVNMNSPSPTDPFFESWNGEIEGRVVAQGQAVADMHAHFFGHGYNHPPNWYASDCTHPNATGHNQLQELFFGLITGT